jgi:hypothetical protein
MRNWIKSGWILGAAAVFGLATASDASAQYCAGFPTVSGQSSLGLRASFPTGGDIFGIEGSYNMAGPLAAFGSVNLAMPAGDDSDNYGIFGAGVAYDISPMVGEALPGFSLCPVAALSFARTQGVTQLLVPLGVGIGAEFGVDGIAIMPYAIPQIVLMRLSGDGASITEREFAIEAGFLARFGALYAGVTLNRFFVDQADTDFGIRAGMTFGTPF